MTLLTISHFIGHSHDTNMPHRGYENGISGDKKRGTSFLVPLRKTLSCGYVLFLLKNVLAQSAGGADPAVGDLVPGGAGGDAVVRVADGGVIDVAAGADILIH